MSRHIEDLSARSPGVTATELPKICIFGPGAIGGWLAATLAHAGLEVCVVARGETLAAILERGLELRLGTRVVRVRVPASDRPAVLGPQDLVIVTVKTTSLGEVARTIGPLLHPATAVMFVANGIPWWYFHAHGGTHDDRRLERLDPGAAMWQAVAPRHVLGAVAATACTAVAPGVVEVESAGRPIVVGEPDGSPSARLTRVAELLTRAGIPVEPTVRIRDRIWSKLAMNLGSAALGLLAPAALKDLFAEPACVEARARIVAEVSAVARAWGCSVSVDEAAQLRWAQASPHWPSIVQDMVSGRPIEFDSMFLQALDLAREAAVPTPTLDLLAALIRLKLRSRPSR